VELVTLHAQVHYVADLTVINRWVWSFWQCPLIKGNCSPCTKARLECNQELIGSVVHHSYWMWIPGSLTRAWV